MKSYTISRLNGETVIGAQRNAAGTLAARVPVYISLPNGRQIEGEESEYGISIQHEGRSVLCKWEIYTTTPRAADFVSFGDGDTYGA